jgi:hypothetical protein
MEATSSKRQRERDVQLDHWSTEHRIGIDHLDEGQKWVVFVALQALAVIGSVEMLRRVVGYVLAHSGMHLGSTLIGALVGVSDRAIRYTQACSAAELAEQLGRPRTHRAPKLGPEHAGPLASYLVTHPRARAADILAFIQSRFGVSMDRTTLHRYIVRYGLGCLRGQVHEDTPLLSERPSTEGHLS